MDTLFLKVINNQFLRNLIFKFVKETNKKLYYTTFNYYDFPLLLVIKTRNESLLYEKLVQYNKYIKNNNNDNNDQIKIKKYHIYKYYLNFNKECLIELFKWNELSGDIFKMVFELFKDEIHIIKHTAPVQDKINVQTMLVYLTRSNHVYGLKYLMQESNGHMKHPIPNDAFKNIISSLDFRLENVNSTLEILNSIKFQNVIFTDDEIYGVLEKVSTYKTSNVYGEMFISKLGVEKSKIHSPLGRVSAVILYNDDKLLLGLLVKRITLTTKTIFTYQVNDYVTMVYENGEIKLNSYLIKLLGITKLMLYSSNMFELFKLLVIDGKTNKDYQEFQLSNSEPYKSGIVISNTEIANYLFENQPVNLLKYNSIVFKYSTINQHQITTNEQYLKSLSNRSREWFSSDFDGLKEYHIEFIIKNNLIPHKTYLIQKLIDDNNLKCLKILFESIPILFSPFEHFVGHTIRYGKEEITNYIFSKESYKDYQVHSESDILDNYFKLLIESIKSGNIHSFKCILESSVHDNLIRYINKYIVDFLQVDINSTTPNNKPKSSPIQILYDYLPKGNFEKRCQFISLLNVIDKRGDLLFSNYKNSANLNWMFPDEYFIQKHFNTNQDYNQLPKTDYINLILSSIQNENYKLLKLLLLSTGLSFNLEHNKKQLIHFTLKNGNVTSNNHFNRSLLYMISIGFLKCSVSDLGRIVKYSIQLKNYTVLNLLLCRGNYKIVPFKNRHALESEFNFHQYIELVHCFILKYSQQIKMMGFIDFLIKDGYQYRSNKVGFENECVKLYLEKQGNISYPLVIKYLNLTNLLSKSLDYNSDTFDLLKDLRNVHIKF